MNAANHGHLCDLADAAAEALTDVQIGRAGRSV